MIGMRLLIAGLAILALPRDILRVDEASPTPETKKTDLENFQGSWKIVVARTIDGDPDRNFTGRKVKISGNKMEFIKKSGESEQKVTFNLDPQKMPKQIDLNLVTTGTRGRITIPGIYSFEKNQLWLAWSAGDRPSRPTDFKKVGGNEEFRVFILEPWKD